MKGLEGSSGGADEAGICLCFLPFVLGRRCDVSGVWWASRRRLLRRMHMLGTTLVRGREAAERGWETITASRAHSTIMTAVAG